LQYYNKKYCKTSFFWYKRKKPVKISIYYGFTNIFLLILFKYLRKNNALGEPLRGDFVPARVGLCAPSPSRSLLRSFALGGSAAIPLAAALRAANTKFEILKNHISYLASEARKREG
jgi:hypothetical protein